MRSKHTLLPFVLSIAFLLTLSALLPLVSAASPHLFPGGTLTATAASPAAKSATLPVLSDAQSDATRSPLSAPDLIVESIVYSPANPDVNESTTITVTVKNQGDEAASGFYVHLYVDPSDNPPVSSTTYTPSTYWGLALNPGASFKWTRTNQTFTVSGTHRIYAWADRDNQVSESDESNNQTGVTIQVGSSSGADSYEPDNTCAQANDIATNGTEQSRNLYPAPDYDWVKFSASAGVLYHVQAIADGADADLTVELYSSCDGQSSFGNGSEIEFTPPADGTYYLKVAHNQDTYGSDTAYRLNVSARNNCAGGNCR